MTDITELPQAAAVKKLTKRVHGGGLWFDVPMSAR